MRLTKGNHRDLCRGDREAGGSVQADRPFLTKPRHGGGEIGAGRRTHGEP